MSIEPAHPTSPEVETFEGLPLRLSFSPDAIREHFEGDDPDPTEGMTDDELREVGFAALTDDSLYRAFHETLVWALEDKETP